MEGRSGQERWAAHFRGIGTGNATTIVPGYGQSASQTQYFQGGMGQLSGPGVAKVTDCSSQAPDADAYRRQDCDAVNFVARNPSVRPAFSIDRATDPLISRANSIASNPALQFTGINVGSSTESLPGGDGYDPRDFYDGNLHQLSADKQFVPDRAPDLGRSVSPLPVRRADADAEQLPVFHRQIAVSTAYNYQCNGPFKATKP